MNNIPHIKRECDPTEKCEYHGNPPDAEYVKEKTQFMIKYTVQKSKYDFEQFDVNLALYDLTIGERYTLIFDRFLERLRFNGTDLNKISQINIQVLG